MTIAGNPHIIPQRKTNMNEKGFYFDPKKWLGDSIVISMDWDCRAMHLHLMAIAWQQEKKGYLLKDDKILLKLLGISDIEDWNNRIRQQILMAWREEDLETKMGIQTFIYQPGLLKNGPDANETKKAPKKERVKKTKLLEFESENQGFNLKEILKLNNTATILNEQSNKEERSSIWSLGVDMMQSQGKTNGQARAFIAKTIKQFGDKAVAAAIGQLSLKEVKPVDIQSYLIGILKKQQETINSSSSKGRVSI